MRSHPQQDDPNLLHRLGYETRDVTLSSLVKWFIFLFVFIAVMSAVSYVVYIALLPHGEAATAFPQTIVRRLPPTPRLQAAPVAEMDAARRMEREVLGNYGPSAEVQGAQRIPIEQAIDLIAERGLPAQPGAAESLPDAHDPGRAAPSTEMETGVPQGASGGSPITEPNGSAPQEPSALEQAPPDRIEPPSHPRSP